MVQLNRGLIQLGLAAALRSGDLTV